MKLSATTRSWIYKVLMAVVPLLVTLDIITSEIAGHVLSIAAAVLAMGGSALAMANVTPDEK
jgi:Na+/H+ antiporter NhaA